MDKADTQSAFKVIHDLHERIAALEDALTRYVDGDDCDCDPDLNDPEIFPCHWCQGAAALGYTITLADRSQDARAWIAAHAA